MIDSSLLLVVMKATTLTFGGILTLLTFRAFRRTGSPAMRALMTGIGLVTIGVFLGGLLHEFFDVALVASASVQSVFTAVGFAVLTYSLYAGGPTEFSGRLPGHGRT
jgi:hypothetical protein